MISYFCIVQKLLYLFLLLPFLSIGQRELWIEGKAKGGFLIAHRAVMGHLATEHTAMGELSFMVQTKGQKAYHKAYKYPRFGGSLLFGSTGNREILGYQTALVGDIRFPLIQQKWYEFDFRVGAGITYGNKVFDNQDSLLIYSIAISSHFNAAVVLGVESRFKFEKSFLSLGMDMTHFSNGATTIPNLGLNLPFVSLGYGRKIQDAAKVEAEFEPFNKYWEFGAISYGSVKQVFPTGSKSYPVMGLNFVGRRYFNHATGMEVSFDIISKQAIMQYQKEIPKTQWDIVQMGIFTGYILPLDRLHLLVGMGYYVKDKFQPEDFLYHRVGMRYVFDNGINLNLVLKSHWARADYIEYGIGYTFRR